MHAAELALSAVLLGAVLLVAVLVLRGRLHASEESLAVAERRLEFLSSDLLPWECDLQGQVLFMGDRCQDYFGYTQQEVNRMNLSELVHPQELERLAGYLERGEPWHNERWRCICKDGTQRWFFGSALPARGPDGVVTGFTGTTHPLGRDALDELRLSAIAARVYRVLEVGQLLPVFQPILSVETGRLIGAEALARFPGSARPVDQWFAEAAEVGLGVELELASLRKALAAALTELPQDVYLSVNVGPHTLARPVLLDTLLDSGFPLERLVVEVTEHASIDEYDEVLAVVEQLRARGVRLAVDDAGAGYASFRRILQLAPEMHASITAEGVETPEELRCAQSLGIHAAQGFLFGRPAADWTTWREWHRRGPLYSVAAALTIRPL